MQLLKKWQGPTNAHSNQRRGLASRCSFGCCNAQHTHTHAHTHIRTPIHAHSSSIYFSLGREGSFLVHASCSDTSDHVYCTRKENKVVTSSSDCNNSTHTTDVMNEPSESTHVPRYAQCRTSLTASLHTYLVRDTSSLPSTMSTG
jgi:hypothetical protein